MALEDLEDEIAAVDAIFPDCSYKVGPQIYGFKVSPQDEGVQVEVAFPEAYPDEAPSIIQVISKNMAHYSDTSYLEKAFSAKLTELYMGEVCMYEFLAALEEMLTAMAEERAKEDEQKKQQQAMNKAREVKIASPQKEEIRHPVANPLEGWTASDPIVDRGSTFIGYCRKVQSVQEAQQYLSILVSEKKIAKAAHNMVAWRIKGDNGVQYQDCDDDGEAAAGGRMLHLLTVRLWFYWLY